MILVTKIPWLSNLPAIILWTLYTTKMHNKSIPVLAATVVAVIIDRHAFVV